MNAPNGFITVYSLQVSLNLNFFLRSLPCLTLKQKATFTIMLK